jgi:thiol-disulfide isomerase/thioredoxin
MKPNPTLAKKIVAGVALLMLAGWLSVATAPAEQPLSKDDITLLLLGSTPAAKMIQMVGQRGVDFQMNPDLAKKFHDQGASDDLIEALQKAGDVAAKASAPAAAAPSAAPAAPAAPSAPAPAPPAAAQPSPPDSPAPSLRGKPNSVGAPEPQAPAPGEAEAPRSAPATPVAPTSSDSEPVLHTRHSSAPAEAPAASIPPSAQKTTTEAKPAAAAAAPAPSDAATEQRIQEILDGLASRPEAPTGPAPTLRIQDINGRKLTPEDFKDKVVLVNFWATWCPYCKTEVPELVRLQRMYGKDGLQVVGIAVQDTKDRVKDFAGENGINYPVAMGDETYKALYGGVEGLPTCFLIGRDGRIYQKIVGAPMDLDIFDQSIKTLLKTSSPKPTMMAQADSPAPTSASSSEPVLHEAARKEAPTETPVTANTPGLKDPDAQGIQHIIQEFAAKEKVFREARNNYTYHQANKVEEFGAGHEIVGTYEQEWDILYDDSGKRIEKVTYAPVNTLKGLIITKEDIEGFRNITPFVLTTDELPDYDIKYLGHVKVDEITAYVFSTRPKEIQKNRQYFQGVVWVDDRDLQIVKSEGKQVPQDKTHHGQENLFPRFTTWREQVDGKFWFPTYTMGEDTLYFSNGPSVHMKEIVRYTDYKQFKSGARILTVEEINKQRDQTPPAATAPKN